MAEGMFYNATGGYIEGVVRGYRNALLTSQNYGNLTQCETIDGMRRSTREECITAIRNRT
jgi:V-type H+-transporting ATPase subunit d